MDKEKVFRSIVCLVSLITFAVALFLVAVIADKHNKKINQQQQIRQMETSKNKGIIVLILAMFLVGCKKEEIKEPELPIKCFDFEVLEGVAVIQYKHGSMTVPAGKKPVLDGVDSITVFCLEPCRYRVGSDTYSSREEFEVCDGGVK